MQEASRQGATTPVIMLTAREKGVDKILDWKSALTTTCKAILNAGAVACIKATSGKQMERALPDLGRVTRSLRDCGSI